MSPAMQTIPSQNAAVSHHERTAVPLVAEWMFARARVSTKLSANNANPLARKGLAPGATYWLKFVVIAAAPSLELITLLELIMIAGSGSTGALRRVRIGDLRGRLFTVAR